MGVATTASGLSEFRPFRVHYVGRDVRGFPCLLLQTADSGVRPPIELDGLSIRFSLPCLVDDGLGQDRQEALTVVVGKSFDPQLQRYFIYVCETMLRIVGNNPTFAQVTQAMQRLIDLFRKLALPSTRSVAGLVGELSIILRSRNAVVAAEAWRSEADNRFDFAYADARLEVKATSMRRRIHNLSLEQCGPPEGTRGLLVSVFIETIGGGLSVLELIRSVEARLIGHNNAILKVQSVIADTLGSSLPAALAVRFDDNLARKSTRFYDLGAIPAIRVPVPPGVSGVHFQSDISRTPNLTGAELQQLSEALADLLPP